MSIMRKNRSDRKFPPVWFVTTFFIFLLLSWTTPNTSFSAPQTNLGLYFEGTFTSTRQSDTSWELWNPEEKYRFNISGWEAGGIDSYLGVESTSNNSGSGFQLYMGHLHVNKRHSETYFFYREDRHWVESPLLFLVSSDRLKDDSNGPKAQGVRYDFKNISGFSGTLLASKYNSWDGEGYVFRATKNILPTLRLATLGTFQDWRGGRGSYNSVISTSGEWRLPIALLSWETALSGGGENNGENHPFDISETASEFEIQNGVFSSLYYLVSLYYFGKDFRANLSNKFNEYGDRNYGRYGVSSKIAWLVPTEMITLTLYGDFYNSNFRYATQEYLENDFLTSNLYAEAYMEFINDVTFKTSCSLTEDPYDSWKSVFFELGAGNSLGKLKFQYLLMDIGVHVNGFDADKSYSAGQRGIAGIETSMHITDSLQFYERLCFGHSVLGMHWSSAFFQLAYKGFRNTEIYLEYGNPDHTNDDMVNDPDVKNSTQLTVEERVKLFLKIWI